MDHPIDPMDDAVARVLDGRRVERRLSVQEVAERSGIPLPTLRRYFRGERAIPMSKFFAVVFAMGLSAVDVMEAALKIVEPAEHEPRG